MNMQKNNSMSNCIKLAVVGNPIVHSLSPQIWQMFAQEFGLHISYDKIYASDVMDFKKLVAQFFADGGTALSITSPFKREAYMLTKYHASLSAFCQASNFICKINYIKNSFNLLGMSTDGIGLIRDIEVNCAVKLHNKKILIIGSGYVLDSILLNIIATNPYSITILARNNERVTYLMNKFSVNNFSAHHHSNVDILENANDFNDLNNHNKYDIIINTIPNLAQHNLFELIKNLSDATICYDMAYAKDSTNFLTAMLQINPRIITKNGLGMLVEQAAVAFTELFKLKPNTQVVINHFLNLGS